MDQNPTFLYVEKSNSQGLSTLKKREKKQCAGYLLRKREKKTMLIKRVPRPSARAGGPEGAAPRDAGVWGRSPQDAGGPGGADPQDAGVWGAQPPGYIYIHSHVKLFVVETWPVSMGLQNSP